MPTIGHQQPFNSYPISGLSTLFRQIRKQLLASLQHVAPSGLKVARIPRVGHITRTAGEIHKQRDFPLRVFATDATHIAQIPTVHADNHVEAVVVGMCHLTRCLAHTTDSVLSQFPTGRRKDRIANLLCRRCRRLNIKLSIATSLGHEILHHKLCHRTTTDISVTDEKYSMYIFDIQYITIYKKQLVYKVVYISNYVILNPFFIPYLFNRCKFTKYSSIYIQSYYFSLILCNFVAKYMGI